ncbi:glycosyltransferase family protein [Corynebacterium riegelii]
MLSDVERIKSRAGTAFAQLKKGNFNYIVAKLFNEVGRITNTASHRRRSILCQDPLNLSLVSPFLLEKAHFTDITAAVILDDFSYQCWRGEFNTVKVTPDGWNKELEEKSIDLLLVESAHAGNGETWTGKIKTSSLDPNLAQLLDWCKQHQIPTVFWNKEDPPHFDDFLATATAFDIIFTTDENMVPRYQEAAPEARVDVLPFAAQPVIHNPARNSPIGPKVRDKRWQQGDIAFAGTFFNHKYSARKKHLEDQLFAAADIAEKYRYKFTIYSRLGNVDKRYRFPKRVQKYIAGSLSADQMLQANREHKVFLNVNSVDSSPTMCSRRVFELPAYGAALLTSPSPAIENFFSPDQIAVAENQDQARAHLLTLLKSPEVRERMVHRAQRTIWNKHCYHHRASKLLEAAGLEHAATESDPLISVIAPSNRPDNMDHLFSQYGRQINVRRELILVCHGFNLQDSQIDSFCSQYEIPHDEVQVIAASEEQSLGECLNAAVEQSTGDFIAKFDDDDLYLPHYLEDMRNAAMYSGADLVGKQACYAYIESKNAIVLRHPEREHIWTNFVAGPTLFGPRATFESFPFENRTNGEDTALLRTLERKGRYIYSADRFNFIQVRGSKHTWQLADAEFMAQGEVRTFGLNEAHVEA